MMSSSMNTYKWILENLKARSRLSISLPHTADATMTNEQCEEYMEIVYYQVRIYLHFLIFVLHAH